MRDQLITRGASKSLLRVRASLHELGLDNSYSYDLGVLLSGPGICFRSDERIACAPRLCQLVRVRRREVIEPQMAVVPGSGGLRPYPRVCAGNMWSRFLHRRRKDYST
jgi:hypothetical protein